MEIKYGYSKVKYAGDGVRTDFAIPFPYLQQPDLTVTIYNADGSVDNPQDTGWTYSFLNSGTVHISPAPAVGQTVWIERDSSLGGERVSYTDSSTITGDDLENGYHQALYVAQEALDEAGMVQAGGWTIDNAVAAAQASQSAAATSASSAAASASAASTSASSAANSATDAANSATMAATSATSASNAVSVYGVLKANNLSDLASVATARTNLGLGDAATHPASDFYSSSNPSGFISAITSAMIAAALGYTPYNGGTNPNGFLTAITGAMVTSALGYTPYNSTNPSGFITSAGAPVQSVFGRSGAVVMGSSDVITALGFTPYNATNPSGYITSSALSPYALLSGATFTGPVSAGGNPEKVMYGGGTIPKSATSLCLKDGSVASPRTNTTYETPMVYLERHTNNPATAQYADWSNIVLQPMMLLEGIAYGSEGGSVTGYAARISSSATAPSTSQPLTAFIGQAESNAPVGTKNRDCWGANFIAKFGSGNKPTNIIGVEADIIPSQLAAAGKKPGSTGADSFLGYFAVVDGRAGGSGNAAFYSYGLSGNWEYGVVLDNVANTFLTTSSTATLVNGIDFSTCHFSGYAWISPSAVITGAGGILSASPTAGIGYSTGAGGTVIQGTSKSTAVTLNKVTGQITTHNAALAAGARVQFWVNNSAMTGPGDLPILGIVGGPNAGSYRVACSYTTGSSFLVTLENISGGSLSDSVVIGFTLVRGVSA